MNKALSLRLGKKQRCLHSSLLFNIVFELLADAISKEKKMKYIPIGKKETKLSLFTDEMILHVENLKESTKQPQLIRDYVARLQDEKLIYKSQSCFYIPATNKWNLNLKT